MPLSTLLAHVNTTNDQDTILTLAIKIGKRHFFHDHFGELNATMIVDQLPPKRLHLHGLTILELFRQVV